MKRIVINIVAALSLAYAMDCFAADVYGDRLIIGPSSGTNHSLSAPAASITGGDYNTNLSYYSTIAGGLRNSILSTDPDKGNNFIGAGGDNFMSDDVSSSIILGGDGNGIYSDNYLCVIGGGSANFISNNSPYSIVAGDYNVVSHDCAYGAILSGENNKVMDHSYFSTIIGGAGNIIHSNSAIANCYATISGGDGNVIGDNGALCVIGGGGQNVITNNSPSSVIGGGALNLIGTNSGDSTISGGGGNAIGPNAQGSTITGGEGNYASGAWATVCGGQYNQATGKYSFAAGFGAGATYDGCFVWAEPNPNNSGFYATSTNQFLVRSDFIWFGTNQILPYISPGKYIDTCTGTFLAADGSGWANSSDRNSKTNFSKIDPIEVLRKVTQLPITSWSYKAGDPSTRHLGPMAQDLYSAFRLGLDDKHIASIDEGGVALAAIQGLNSIVEQKETQISELKDEVSQLKEQLQTRQGSDKNMRARLDALESAFASRESLAPRTSKSDQ